MFWKTPLARKKKEKTSTMSHGQPRCGKKEQIGSKVARREARKTPRRKDGIEDRVPKGGRQEGARKKHGIVGRVAKLRRQKGRWDRRGREVARRKDGNRRQCVVVGETGSSKKERWSQ